MDTKNNKTKLSNIQIYTYGMGEFGFTFFLLFVGYYLMFFLTDVLMLPPIIVATLYTLVQWFETITVVASGVIMDRITFKNGRFRPWLIYGGGTCFIGMILFFTHFPVPTNYYIVLFPLFYLISYWGYNFMWVAYRALNGIIGQTPEETVSLTVTGSQMGTVASLVFSLISVKLLYGFSSPDIGFTVSSVVYGLIMFVCLLLVYKLAKPYDKCTTSVSNIKKEKITIKETLSGLKGPMLPYFISSTLRSSVTSVVNALMVYHFNYNLNNPNLMSIYMTSVTIGQLIGVFFVKILSNKFGKKKMYIFSSIASSAVLVCAYFVSMKPYLFIGCMALNNFCAIFGGSLMPAFMNDIADYDEYVLGLRTRAFTYSIGATAIRLASIIGGAVASFGLALIGYSGSEELSSSVLQAIVKLMTLFPAALMLLCIIPMLFYKLDETQISEISKKKTEQAAL